MLLHQTTARSIEVLLRSTLANYPANLEAFDLAVAELARKHAPDRVSVAMKAEVAAAIMEFSASSESDSAELVRHALHRVSGMQFRRLTAA